MRNTFWRGMMVAALVAVCGGGARGELTGRQVIDRALAVQEAVRDYTARCTLTAQIPGTDLPTRHFKVYYKRPNRVKIESQELILVPREALTLGELRRHLTEDTEVVLAGVGTLEGQPLYCVKMKPPSGGGAGRVLVWIRGDRWTPTRTELWQGDTRLVRIAWQFARYDEQYWLPTQITAEVPSGILTDQGPASLTLAWDQYQVNTGLSDDLFQE